MGLTTTSGLSFGGGLSVGSGLSIGSGLSTNTLGQWVSAVQKNGGTVSAARQIIVQTFITAEIVSGAWSLTDDYWPLWGEDAGSSLVSLKQRRVAASLPAGASATFTASRGYVFNGTTQYIDTFFIPASGASSSLGIAVNAVAMTPGNLRLAIYERTNVGTNTVSIGFAGTGSSTNLNMRARNGSSQWQGLIGSGNTTLASVTTSLGYTAASRSLTSTISVYENGTLKGTATAPTIVNSTLPQGSSNSSISYGITIAANGNGGGNAIPNLFRASSVGFACVGAPLTAAQELAQYNAVQAWATSIGANV